MKMYTLHNLWYSLIKKKSRRNLSKDKNKRKSLVKKLLSLLECITKIANVIDKLIDFFNQLKEFF
ncbi:hypothetical protein ACEQ103284_06585 [Actinobacillus equuli subsp. equuli]|uniref:Uncharacterized protein n=1 Tax=Actinobacillus equuli TaxID=718 RepID=A0AAX3FIN6_ACTEU|nr:hypothetical protein ACEE_08105 [Actinobacillus equuli subsp. equuli]SUT98475.1 Uncharacterised protein [Actinobacillus lignieresii]VEE90538.1 Uncharacterised protein [Actinobacillus equuli]